MWPIGNMAWRVGRTLDVPKQIEWSLRAGFDGVSFHGSPGTQGHWRGIDPGQADADLRERLRRLVGQFRRAEIHAPFSATLAEGQLHESTEALRPVLAFAGDVAAHVVTVHAAPPSGEERRGEWGHCLQQLNDQAEERGLTIGLEITHGFEWVRGLGLPRIGITLDVGHLYLNQARPLALFGSTANAVRAAGRQLVHVHMHDYDGQHDHVELGTGQVDIIGVLTGLADIDYRGGICLELNPDRVSPRAMKRSLRWLRARIEELRRE